MAYDIFSNIVSSKQKHISTVLNYLLQFVF